MLGFGVLNAIYGGGLNTLGPVLANDTDIGAHGWGLIMSAEAVGLFVMTLLMLRIPLQRPLLLGDGRCRAVRRSDGGDGPAPAAGLR